MKIAWRTLLCCLCTAALLAGCAPQVEAEGNEETKIDTEQPEVKEEETETDAGQPEGSDDDDIGVLKYVEPLSYVSTEGIELDPATYIAVVGKGKDSEFWKRVKSGATQAVDDLNTQMGYSGSDKIKMTYDAPSDEDKVAEQINVLDEALGSYPDAVALAVVDVQAFETQFDYMTENSIKVVAFDSGIENDSVMALSSTDNRAAAVEAAKHLCEMIGDEGQVAVMMHNHISTTGIDREEAFLEEIRENHPDVKVVDVSYMNTGEVTPEEAVRQVLERYPDLKGYFSSNYAADEVVRKVCREEAGKSIVKVSFDGTESQITAIRNGELDGVVVQNPYAMGYTAVIAAARAIMTEDLSADDAEDLPAFINTGCMWVHEGNIDDEEVQIYLNK